MRLTIGVRSVLRCERCNATQHTTHTYNQAQSQQRNLTQHDILPQHPINVRELINAWF